MRTQADRDDDLAIGRELESKDAEIDRLKADLATFGKDTEATENRVIDAEFAATEAKHDNMRLRTALNKTIAWLDRLATQSDAQAKNNRGRFDSLADACAADAKNYRATAADLRSVVNQQSTPEPK